MVVKYLGPVVQSIVNLTSLLVIKMYNIELGIFAEKKNVSSFCSHFFCKNIRVYAIFNDQSFIDYGYVN